VRGLPQDLVVAAQVEEILEQLDEPPAGPAVPKRTDVHGGRREGLGVGRPAGEAVGGADPSEPDRAEGQVPTVAVRRQQPGDLQVGERGLEGGMARGPPQAPGDRPQVGPYPSGPLLRRREPVGQRAAEILGGDEQQQAIVLVGQGAHPPATREHPGVQRAARRRQVGVPVEQRTEIHDGPV